MAQALVHLSLISCSYRTVQLVVAQPFGSHSWFNSCSAVMGKKPNKNPDVQFNPFPDPKKGKGRSVLKRPAKRKSQGWQNIPYVRTKDAINMQRMDRVTWKRKLMDFLETSVNALIQLLHADRLLHDWTGHTCPRCEKGKLSKLQPRPDGGPKHRCSARGCQAYINPHHLHPLFTDGTGTGHASLQTQCALLFLLLNRVPNPAIHRILHKSIEDMEKRLMHLRKAWVEEKEKFIVFGNGKSWADIEADETTFTNADFKDLAEDPKKPVGWEQWYGLVPDTLLLKRLFPLMSAKPAPDPGAIRNVEWKSLAHKHLQNRRGILTLMPPSPIACVCLVSFMTISNIARRESK